MSNLPCIRKAEVAVGAVSAEVDAGGDGDVGVVEECFGEGERVEHTM